MLGKTRVALWLLVAFAAAGALFLVLRPAQPMRQAEQAQLGPIGGPFTLVNSDGQPFASSRLTGKPAAIFFGFIHCPDVCPTTLARLIKLRRQLGNDDLAIVFVSVDPARDRPADLARFAELFDNKVIALTGSEAQVEKVKQLFGVFSQKVPEPGGEYGVNHTAAVFVMDRDGKFVSTIAPDEDDVAALAKLRRVAG
ncbi:MAG: SCO family protein [Sphingomonas sp.]|uniref:SCO family protein n=1 Tax=Sphingomonas sp. TaxID=28214 RepID=UPI00183833EE|nr:SCO family protein [Sphingomonas sp.]MBA3666953.1 SCO family protein [Sphingomonas sp.]